MSLLSSMLNPLQARLWSQALQIPVEGPARPKQSKALWP